MFWTFAGQYVCTMHNLTNTISEGEHEGKVMDNVMGKMMEAVGENVRENATEKLSQDAQVHRCPGLPEAPGKGTCAAGVEKDANTTSKAWFSLVFEQP